MLGKFKGFCVPGKKWSGPQESARNTRQVFCHKSKIEDCEITLDDEKGMNCDLCLFDCYSTGDKFEAFDEWHKAKGKVQYDKEEAK